MVPALSGILAAGIGVHVRVGLAEDLLGDLAAGRLDLVVSTVRPRRGGIHAEPLCDEEFALVAAPALAGQLDQQLLTTDPASALGALPLLAYSEDLAIVRRWWRHVLGRPPTARPALLLPDLRGLLAAATAGLGATVLPLYLCTEDLAAGRLVSVYPSDDPPINTLYLAVLAAARSRPHLVHVWAALLLQAKLW